MGDEKEQVNRCKLEIYVPTVEDLKMLMHIIEMYVMFEPKYKLEPFHESTVKVTHYHYELKRNPQ